MRRFLRKVAPGLPLRSRPTPQPVPLEHFGLRKKLDPSVYNDKYCKHQAIVGMPNKRPSLGSHVFIAPSATVVGNVEIWDKSSVWYNCVIIADRVLVRVGAGTNIQDSTVITESTKELNYDHDGSTIIGNWVTIGHRCVLSGCTVEDSCLVGMGSVLSPGSYMEEMSILGAGSVLLPNQRVPHGQIWRGNPAVYYRDLTHEEEEMLEKSSIHYEALAGTHSEEFPYYNTVYLDAEKKGVPVGYQLHGEPEDVIFGEKEREMS